MQETAVMLSTAKMLEAEAETKILALRPTSQASNISLNHAIATVAQ